MIRKRGLSSVVTTLLIILVAIVAIGIVWVVIKNVLNQGTSGIGISQFTLDLGIKSAYINGQIVNVDVRRSAGQGNITGVHFIFHNGTSSVGIDKEISLAPLEEKSFVFTADEVGGIENLELVSVAPLFSSGGKNQVGDITDTAEIKPTPPGPFDNGTDEEDICNNDGTCLNDENEFNCPSDCQPEGSLCENNVCDAGEDISCPADCPVPPSCNGVWDQQQDLADGNECDGGGSPGGVPHCSAGCMCAIGYNPDGSGNCIIEASLNFGTIESTWPGGVVKYFDSGDLPKNSETVQSYIGKYVNFSGSETRCLQISYAEYLSDPAYDRSYIRIELPASIVSGNNYEIWVSPNCGS